MIRIFCLRGGGEKEENKEHFCFLFLATIVLIIVSVLILGSVPDKSLVFYIISLLPGSMVLIILC